MNKFICVAFAALLACASAAAQPSFPGPRPQVEPIPQPNPQTNLERQSPPGRPRLQRQMDLPVSNFAATDLRCAADLASATMQISARLGVQRDAVNGNNARIDVLLDGVSIGAESLTASGGFVTISRRVNLTGATGEHTIVFTLEGVRSDPQTFNHACVAQRQIRTDAQPGVATLPNLAFGNILYAQIRPPRRFVDGGTSALGTPRYGTAEAGLRPGYRRLEDIQTLIGPIPIPSSIYCPREQDAFVTAEIVIEIIATRTANPEQYVEVSAQSSPASFLDTSATARFPNGATPAGRSGEGEAVEQGHKWIVIHPALACTRNGVLEVRLDPTNRLSESNEGDNLLRLRYSTVP